MTLDIYTDARAEIIPKDTPTTKFTEKQKEMQIASVIVDANENEYYIVERISVDNLSENWLDLKDIRFKPNSNIAEMYSIHKALTEICKLDIKVDKINLYTDSMNSFNFINQVPLHLTNIGCKNPNRLNKPSCKLIKKINNEIILLKKTLEKSGIELNIMWVKGHAGVYFNEAADKLCRFSNNKSNTLYQLTI